MVKSKLTNIRKQIDRLDQTLFTTLNKRSFLIPKVKEIKESWHYHVAFAREIAMAKKIAESDFGLYSNIFMQKIWRELISATLDIECNMKIMIYKNPSNYHGLWEISKDHFSGGIDLLLMENIQGMFDNLIEKKCECIILPSPGDSDIKWWEFLLFDNYKQIKINLLLPFLSKIKTLSNTKGFCLSLNDKDISEDFFFYILPKRGNAIIDNSKIEILDVSSNNYFIKSNLTQEELALHFNITQHNIIFVGSSPVAI